MSCYRDIPRLPVIDLSLYEIGDPWRDHVSAQLDWAAREFGFFYVIGHGIESALIDSVVEAGRSFFRMREAQAQRLRRVREVGAFGLAVQGDPANSSSLPDLPGFRQAVTEYVQALTGLAQKLTASLGRALELGDSYFSDRVTGNPVRELRILDHSDGTWAHSDADAHRDRGLLTLTYHSEHTGLQVEHATGWIDVPHVRASFLVSVGEIFEWLTRGRYGAALQRRVPTSGQPGIAMPFFFNPASGDLVSPIARLGTAVALSGSPRRLPANASAVMRVMTT
jgi:isopenicillin N synthase-like dioxygenase